MERLIGVVGLFLLVAAAYLFSENRKKINTQLVVVGISLQFVLALLILGVPSLGIKGPLKRTVCFGQQSIFINY